MANGYTNAALTVIAAALCALVYQNAAQEAFAREEGCGSRSNPCFVRAENASGLDVNVTNWPQSSK